jgi:hypothetical protein
MSRSDAKRVAVVLLLALSVASCSDDDTRSAQHADSGWTGDWPDANDAGRDAGSVVSDAARPADIDASADASVLVDSGAPIARTTACLDRPGLLAAAPTGPLPCELLPPGLTL